jgi:hypothetical protein
MSTMLLLGCFLAKAFTRFSTSYFFYKPLTTAWLLNIQLNTTLAHVIRSNMLGKDHEVIPDVSCLCETMTCGPMAKIPFDAMLLLSSSSWENENELK